jgi:hypothetical protein
MTNKYYNHFKKAVRLVTGIPILLFCVLVFGGSVNGQTIVETFQTTGLQTYTVPAGVTQITVEAWGGGGAGGGAVRGRGGGGGGGAYAKSILTVTSGAQYNLFVASFKESTVTSSAEDNNGNSSWFDTESRLIAKGGIGGAPAFNTNGIGGIGSISGSIGDDTFNGGSGTNGNNGGTGGGGAGSTEDGGNGNSSSGGTGGSELGGNGGSIATNNNPGNSGINLEAVGQELNQEIQIISMQEVQALKA